MAEWVRHIIRQERNRLIVLPAKFIREHISPSDRYVFLIDEGNGALRILTQKRWYDEKLSKNFPKPNPGAESGSKG